MLLNHHLISSRYFFPMHAPISEPFLVQTNGATLACYHQQNDADAPTLVHFHGNGEVVADYLPAMANHFLAMGLNIFFAEYRGYGGSTGNPALGTMLEDIQPIFDTLGVAEDKVIVFGRSVGSIFALEWVHRYPRTRALILESAIAEPLERLLLRVQPVELGCTLEELKHEVEVHLNHREKISSYSGPTLLLHTLHDHIVNIRHAEHLHHWSSSPQKRLIEFKHGDHNSIFHANQAQYLSQIKRFIANYS